MIQYFQCLPSRDSILWKSNTLWCYLIRWEHHVVLDFLPGKVTSHCIKCWDDVTGTCSCRFPFHIQPAPCLTHFAVYLSAYTEALTAQYNRLESVTDHGSQATHWRLIKITSNRNWISSLCNHLWDFDIKCQALQKIILGGNFLKFISSSNYLISSQNMFMSE